MHSSGSRGLHWTQSLRSQSWSHWMILATNYCSRATELNLALQARAATEKLLVCQENLKASAKHNDIDNWPGWSLPEYHSCQWRTWSRCSGRSVDHWPVSHVSPGTLPRDSAAARSGDSPQLWCDHLSSSLSSHRPRPWWWWGGWWRRRQRRGWWRVMETRSQSGPGHVPHCWADLNTRLW